MVLRWSKTQPVIALSSGEAELNAVLKRSAEAVLVKEMYKLMAQDIDAEVHRDSGACIGIANREGSGKVKHFEVKQLGCRNELLRSASRLSKYHVI